MGEEMEDGMEEVIAENLHPPIEDDRLYDDETERIVEKLLERPFLGKKNPADYIGVTFDDVLIIPQYSDIDSRSQIDTSVDFLGFKLDSPIISANMDYITGPEMVKAMYYAGGMGILHRFAPWEEQLKWMEDLDVSNIPFFFSIGVRDMDESYLNTGEATRRFENCRGVLIDVAHGHHKNVALLIEKIKSEFEDIDVIAGNVATAEGCEFLVDAGATAVKVGIGAGSVCTTRTVAGVGVPQLSALVSCSEYLAEVGVPMIADGGIKGSADLIKALAAGARTVMVGSLLAGTKETPAPTIYGTDGRKYRPYRGQSIFGTNGERYVREGIEGYVDESGPVEEVIENLTRALRSGMSYVGARTIRELQDYSQFMVVSHSTAAENHTRVRTQL